MLYRLSAEGSEKGTEQGMRRFPSAAAIEESKNEKAKRNTDGIRVIDRNYVMNELGKILSQVITSTGMITCKVNIET